VVACPRDPAVHAKYAKAELCLGCPSRATAVLLRALDVFAVDARTREWLEKEVTATPCAKGAEEASRPLAVVPPPALPAGTRRGVMLPISMLY